VFIAMAACNARLPEPDSAGAKLYAARCGACHRLYAPSSLTFEMWKIQVERKQGTMVRQGLPPLTPQERDVVLDYLKRHSQ
jgi:mono/diheme cytochrome c family protein